MTSVVMVLDGSDVIMMVNNGGRRVGTRDRYFAW